MSYHDDPSMPRHPLPQEGTSYTGWILTGIATLVVLFGLMFMFGRNDGTSETASTSPNRPQVGTTGQSSPPPAPANR
jgi:hypothetical protein